MNLCAVHSAFGRNVSSFSHPQVRILNNSNAKIEHEETFWADHINTILALTSLTITFINLIFMCKIFKDYKKLRTLTVAMSLLKTAHTFPIPPPVPANTPTTLPEDPAPVVCYDAYVSVTLTLLSLISVLIIVYQQWKNKNMCSGYVCSNMMDIKLVLAGPTYYIPLSLRKAAGACCKISLNGLPNPSQLTLVKNWLWDTMTIDWAGTELCVMDEYINLPNTLVIPLRAKWKVRELVREGFHVSLAICKGGSWYDLGINLGVVSCVRPPPTRPPKRKMHKRSNCPRTPPQDSAILYAGAPIPTAPILVEGSGEIQGIDNQV